MMAENAAKLAATYFDSWRAKDFTTLRSILADDATFVGPLGHADNADECVKGIEGLSQITTDIIIQKRWVNGPDVLTWFDLHTSVAPPIPVVNWSHVEDGKIRRVRATFDPRPLIG